MKYLDADIWHMRSALNLARMGLGRVAPNPTVGCVLVKDGKVIARARTADSGRPHAETQALTQAGALAKGATAYVTLEPCSHTGETGPCAQALIDAGIVRVVIATLDSDARVSGRGVQMLQEAGIDVVIGILKDEARDLNAGYFLAKEENRPLITLKTASTLDSKIATSTGESKWITGKKARSFAHIERAQHDAILVGVNTVLADNPSLTTRVSGVTHDAIRIVLDTNLRLKGNEQLFDNTDKNHVWVVTSKDENDAKMLIDKGAEIINVSKNDHGQVDVHEALTKLAEKGLTRILVEGGASVVTSFLRERLFDRFLWFRSASIIGSNANDSVKEIGISALNEMIKLCHYERRILGEDVLDIYNRTD